MKIMVFAAAEHVIIDQQFNDASFINLIDEVRAAGFPMLLPFFQFMAVIDREAKEPQKPGASISISCGKTVLFEKSVGVDFADRYRTRCIGTIHGMTIPGPGTLKCAFKIQGAEPFVWTANVTQLEGPKLETRSGPPRKSIVKAKAKAET